MAEFSIIDRFCRDIGAQHPATKISVGDDAAVISVPDNMELAISLDTMVEGVHFYPDTAPEDIAHKLLAVNLSDMAAMGAKPRWATLGLTLPSMDEDWISRFSSALNDIAQRYKVQLIGGDTTQGSLNLCINIMGLLPIGKALTRSKARIEDDVYVSNTIGDAALALHCIDGKVRQDGLNFSALRIALDRPEPQIDLGLKLLNIASACMDVSDGLIADLGHIAKQSKVSFDIDVERIPLSSEYRQYTERGGKVDIALTGGDDYQLVFTANPKRRSEVQQLATDLETPLTQIGKVVEARDSAVNLFSDGQPYKLNSDAGYEHFKA